MVEQTSLPVVTTSHRYIGNLLESLYVDDHVQTIIIACHRRPQVLRELGAYVSENSGHEINRPVPSENVESQVTSQHAASTRLLTASLKLLVVSQKTNIVFCRSIPAFRAYLSTIHLRQNENSDIPSRIIILDMLALHHGTSEFTVQGLSRTFATLASVNHMATGRFQVVECHDAHDPSNPYRGSELWETEVPLLSGSVKIGEAGQGWANKRTTIRSFADRWFTFD